jgi:hypothetical protein
MKPGSNYAALTNDMDAPSTLTQHKENGQWSRAVLASDLHTQCIPSNRIECHWSTATSVVEGLGVYLFLQLGRGRLPQSYLPSI